MRPGRIVLAVALLGAILTSGQTVLAQGGQPTPASSAPVARDDGGWPQDFKGADATVTVYQPQIETWSSNQLTARAAVQVIKVGDPAPKFGTMQFAARTAVDKTQRLVTLTGIQVTSGAFPTDAANADSYLGIVRQNLPAQLNYSLDRMQANLAITQGEAPAQAKAPVKNDVPQLIVATDPSALVLIDGQPALRSTSDSATLRIVNTRALVLFNQQTNTYYLRIMGRWASASSLTGTWTATNKVPPANDQIRQAMGTNFDPMVGTLTEAQAARQPLPKVYVATGPAELLQISGQPNYQPIPGTQLLDVTNTSSNIILNLADNRSYILVSGRWFAGPSLSGPWTYVPNNQLPADFAKIPEAHPRGAVLPAVANTPQAKEAVIAASVPQTATVIPTQAKFSANYDGGKPIWGPIPDTRLQYAANSPNPVIQVSPASYFAVSNGVWFTSNTPFGPWAVARIVPPEIYTIPPSSPVYYVTGVQVYGGPDGLVYVGYTPVYMGTAIGPYGTVVYGTGYVYPPYVGPTAAYYPPPSTYGYGAGFTTGMLTGFTFGFIAGSLMSHPWWGPYPCCGSFGNTTINNVNNVYNRWGSNSVLHNSQEYNNYLNNHPDVRNQIDRDDNRLDRQANRDQAMRNAGLDPNYRAQAQRDQNRDVSQINRDMKNDPAAQARANQYMSDHPAVDNDWTKAEQQQQQARQQAASDARNDAQKRDDMYAGQDGHAYRPSNGGGWERPNSSGGWDKSQDANTNRNLDQQRSARQFGDAQYRQARQAPHYSSWRR